MLTDIIKPRVVQVGCIKIGRLGEKRKKQGKDEYYRLPQKLDHFIITTMHRDEEGLLVPDNALMAGLKKEFASSDGNVRTIPIQFLSNNIDEIMQSAFLWYSGKKLAGRSDGKTLTLFADPDKRTWLPEPIETAWTPEWANKVDNNNKPIFKINTVLNCVISMSGAQWGGVYRFRTGSPITSENLLSTLTGLSVLTGGVYRGLPFRLIVDPMRCSPTVNGVKTSQVVYVVRIALVGDDMMAIRQMAMQTAKMELSCSQEIIAVQNQYTKLLKLPGWGETPAEQAEIQQELFPESEDETTSPGVDPLAAQLGIVDEPEIDGETIPETTIDDDGNFEPITPAQVAYLTGILANKTNCDKFLRVMLDRWTISAFDKIPVSLFDEIKKAAFEFVKPQEEKK